ncbi:TlpA family protein disulfide reductase [Massilia arenosa]|uniref:TlpA family protein disulfide reductase n=1 Tax=Zemynaea arenosa TaxID=2561931 RepID=A0A4Y9RSF0_9BURK|nr:TlpA disulfide reductase family protein [Massilia arenosa]TFW10716.1 TlpA family protein disulfide reductase [Massilia arenosa]
MDRLRSYAARAAGSAVVCAAGITAALAGGTVRAATPGQPAPAFSLAGRDGTVDLARLRGQFVYVDFWASWCGPCKRSFPWMNGLQQRYGRSGLQIVAVNVDTARADAERFLVATPASFTVAFDPAGATPRSYAIKGMPSSVLVDPSGNVVFQHAGFNEGAAQELEQKIARAMAASAATAKGGTP